MTRVHFTEWLTEAAMLGVSGGFLTWYLWAKVMTWPLGAWTL